MKKTQKLKLKLKCVKQVKIVYRKLVRCLLREPVCVDEQETNQNEETLKEFT